MAHYQAPNTAAANNSVFAPQMSAAAATSLNQQRTTHQEQQQLVFDDKINFGGGGQNGGIVQPPATGHVFQPQPLADNGNKQLENFADDNDAVNLDGISDRNNYGLRESFQLVDKFSAFNHLVPGDPVPLPTTQAQKVQ